MGGLIVQTKINSFVLYWFGESCFGSSCAAEQS